MWTNENNIIENLVCFIYGGAGAGAGGRTFAPAPAPTKKYRLRNTACTRYLFLLFKKILKYFKLFSPALWIRIRNIFPDPELFVKDPGLICTDHYVECFLVIAVSWFFSPIDFKVFFRLF